MPPPVAGDEIGADSFRRDTSCRVQRIVSRDGLANQVHLTPRRALLLLLVCSTVVRFVLALRVQAMSIMPDEAVFAMSGRSFWRTGHYSLLDADASFYGLYALVAGLPLAVLGPDTGVPAVKLLQALLVSSTAALTYAWARRLTGPWWSLAAAAATAALPALGYSGLIMSETLYLPAATLALLAMTIALQSPTRAHQCFAVLALLAAALVRVQGLVLVPTFVLAVLLLAWFTRDRASVRRFVPSFIVFTLAGGAIAILYLVGVVARPLGAYTPVAQSQYELGSVLLWILRHAGDAFLVVLGIPLIAMLLLGVQAARGAERDGRFAGTLAVALAYTGLVVVQAGIFASEFVDQLGERYLITIAPPLFVVFVVWLARGMPRPQPVASVVAVCVALPALLLPTHRLVTQFATVDAFMLVPLLRLREVSSLLTLQLVWTMSVVALVVVVLALPQRFAPMLAAGVAVALVVASGFAAKDLERWTHAERTFLFGSSDLRWIDEATKENVLYVYGGDPYWNRVWQTAFWNEKVVAVAALPTEARRARDLVSGSLPGRASAVLTPDGRVERPDGSRPEERMVVAFDDVVVVGKRVPTQTAPPGYSLWRIDGPPVVVQWTQGLSSTREIRNLATVTIPGCVPGALSVDLASLGDARAVSLSVNGSHVGRVAVPAGGSWRGVIPAPSVADGDSLCVFGFHSAGGVRLGRATFEQGETRSGRNTPKANEPSVNTALLGLQVAYCVRGVFTMLLYGEPASDPAYRGATAARFVDGKGLTCDAPPAGFRRRRFAGEAEHVPAGFYPYYAP